MVIEVKVKHEKCFWVAPGLELTTFVHKSRMVTTTLCSTQLVVGVGRMCLYLCVVCNLDIHSPQLLMSEVRIFGETKIFR